MQAGLDSQSPKNIHIAIAQSFDLYQVLCIVTSFANGGQVT